MESRRRPRVLRHHHHPSPSRTIEDIYIEDVVERRAFEFDGAITAGDSGAPIFGETGDVLGIVYARSRERGVGFAVSTTEIRPVLDSITDSRADTGRCI